MDETQQERDARLAREREAAEQRLRAVIREELSAGTQQLTTPRREGRAAPGLDPNTEIRRGPAVDLDAAFRIETSYARRFMGAERRLAVARPSLAQRLATDPNGREMAQRLIGWARAFITRDFVAQREFVEQSYRALGGQTMGEGQALVPIEFSQEVIAKLGDLTPFASTEFLRVIPMASEREVVPRLTTRPKAGFRNENETSTLPAGVEPRWGQLELVAREAWLLVPVSNRWLQNISIAGVEYLIDLFADALAELRNDKLINGSGAAEPEGVRQNAGVATNAFVTTNDQTKAKSVITTMHKVKAKYRGDGIWLTSDTGLERLSGLQDTTGRFLLTQLEDEPFQRLRGKPVMVTEAVPNNLGAGSDTELIFGNWKYYAFGDRMQMEAATDQGGKYFEAGQTAVRVSEQYDGKVAQAEAFVRGTGV